MCLLFETHNDNSTKPGQEGVVWTLTLIKQGVPRQKFDTRAFNGIDLSGLASG